MWPWSEAEFLLLYHASICSLSLLLVYFHSKTYQQLHIIFVFLYSYILVYLDLDLKLEVSSCCHFHDPTVAVNKTSQSVWTKRNLLTNQKRELKSKINLWFYLIFILFKLKGPPEGEGTRTNNTNDINTQKIKKKKKKSK